MSAMKAIYTYLQEQGINPETCTFDEFAEAAHELGFDTI